MGAGSPETDARRDAATGGHADRLFGHPAADG